MKKLLIRLLEAFLLPLCYVGFRLGGVIMAYALFGSLSVGLCYLIKLLLNLFSVSHEVFVFVVKIVLTIASAAAHYCYFTVASNDEESETFFSLDLTYVTWITATILIWKVI